MRWMVWKVAADFLDMSPDALQGRGRRGTWPRFEGADGFFYYAVPDENEPFQNIIPDPSDLGYNSDGPSYKKSIREGVLVSKNHTSRPSVEPPISSPSEPSEKPVLNDPDEIFLEEVGDTKYHSEVDKDEGVVIAFMPFLKKGYIRVPLSVDKQIQQAYSDEGSRMTIRELAHNLNWQESIMKGYLKARGVTHASHIWPMWEIESKGEEELIEDWRIAKAERAKARAERLEVERIKRDAEIGRRFRELSTHLSNVEFPPYVPVPLPPLTEAGFDVYFPMKDLHIGKRPFDSDLNYSLAEQEARVKESIEILVERVLETWGVPRRWILVTGDDQLNSNDSQQKTLRGTPQGTNSVGSWDDQATTLLRVKIHQIQACLAAGGMVHDHYIRSNHAPDGEFLLSLVLNSHFRTEDRVMVDSTPNSFKSVRCGSTPVFDCHGHGLSDADLPAIAARHQPPNTDFAKGVIFRGHTHAGNKTVLKYNAEKERVGLQIIVVPSAGPVCAYEEAHGWGLSRPVQSAYRIDYAEGMNATVRV